MSSAPRKVGRPALPPDQLRSNIVSVRLSETELALLAQAAREQGVAETIREFALSVAKRRRSRETAKIGE